MPSLIGCGSHGRDLMTIWHRAAHGLTLVRYDDDPSTGFPPPPDDLTGQILIGVNDPQTRRQIADRFQNSWGIDPLVDPSAVIGDHCHLERGVVIAPLVSLLRSVMLGDHTHINCNASLTRCWVGRFTTISPGATICGDVEIGDECSIGANATICDRVEIGNHVTIGAGAIVPPCSVVPDHTTVIGVYKG